MQLRDDERVSADDIVTSTTHLYISIYRVKDGGGSRCSVRGIERSIDSNV